MNLLFKATQIFQKYLCDNLIKNFYDSLNIVVIFGPGREFYLLNVLNFL